MPPATVPNMTATLERSVVAEMVSRTPPDWDGPDSVLPDGRAVAMATEAERILRERGITVHAVPLSGGGISLSWPNRGGWEYLNIEGGDPEAERYSSFPGIGVQDYRASTSILELAVR